MIKETEILFCDKKVFKDKKEHAYDCKCYDGYAICKLADEDDKTAPKVIRVTYPKRKDVLKNKDMCEYILEYRGLYDLSSININCGDIMVVYGVIDHIVEK